eukprot:g2731.t1
MTRMPSCKYNTRFVASSLTTVASQCPTALYAFARVGTPSFSPLYAAVLAAPSLLYLSWNFVHYTRVDARGRFWISSEPLLRDYDCFVVRSLHALDARWTWFAYVVSPLVVSALLVLMCFVAADADAASVSSFRFWTVNTFGIYALSRSVGPAAAAVDHSAEQQARWAGEKRAFEAAHPGSAGIVDAFEHFAARQAAAATRAGLQSSRGLFCYSVPGFYVLWRLASLALIAAEVAADGHWPGLASLTLASVGSAPVAALIWGASATICITLPRQYAFNRYLARALSVATVARHAASEGLPHVPVDTPAGLARWLRLRQLFVTERFPMQYNVCSATNAAVAGCCWISLLLLALVTFGDQPRLFRFEWHFWIVLAVTFSVWHMYLLVAVASVYPAQQQHTRLLREAGTASMLAQAVRELATTLSQHELLERVAVQVRGEPDCPQVFGIPVRPRFFWIVFGYVGTTGLALAVKGLSLVWWMSRARAGGRGACSSHGAADAVVA